MQRGRTAEAYALFQRAQRLKTVSIKDGSSDVKSRHPEVLADLEGLAQANIWLVQYRQAKDMLQEALDITNNELAARNSRRCKTLLVLARYMLDIGRYSEAYKVLQGATATLHDFSERSPLMVQLVMQQAALDMEVGFLAQSYNLLESIEDLGVLPQKHPDRAELMWQKARIQQMQYHFEDARVLLDSASALLRSSGLGSEEQRVKSRHRRLADACQHVAKKHASRPMIVKFITTIVPLSWKLLDRQDSLKPMRMRFKLMDATLLVQEGKLSEATALLAELMDGYAEQNREAAVTNSHPLVGCCKTASAQIAFAQGRFVAAREAFSSALDNKLDGGWLPTHTFVSHDHHGMGLCALMRADYEHAREKLNLAKLILLRAAADVSTMASLAVDLSLAKLSLELGMLRPN